ncbi:MAG TPA: cytochrome c [Steroidobacteraceae bacterium]|nr:cytochrome c [Steroidobacteraceae bacterium]
MTKMALSILCLFSVLTAGPLWAADVAAGQAKSDELCADCHGEKGYGDDTFPSVAGMPVEDFTKAMQEYQDGTRDHRRMVKIAKELSDADIADLAAYFAQFAPDE